jgi:hypothetical protein
MKYCITYFKRILVCGIALSSMVVVLYVWKSLIPCSLILAVVHTKNLHHHAIDNLGMFICMKMEHCWHG